MKKSLLLVLLFLFYFCFNVSAFGVGVSPSKIDLGKIELTRSYETEVLVVNPNDFGIAFVVKTPKGVQVTPVTGVVSPQTTRTLNLVIEFNNSLPVEEDLLIFELRKLTNSNKDEIGMIPAVAVALNFNSSVKQKPKLTSITGNVVANFVNRSGLRVFGNNGQSIRLKFVKIGLFIAIIISIGGFLIFKRGVKTPPMKPLLLTFLDHNR